MYGPYWHACPGNASGQFKIQGALVPWHIDSRIIYERKSKNSISALPKTTFKKLELELIVQQLAILPNQICNQTLEFWSNPIAELM